jgi:hypothetical protein
MQYPITHRPPLRSGSTSHASLNMSRTLAHQTATKGFTTHLSLRPMTYSGWHCDYRRSVVGLVCLTPHHPLHVIHLRSEAYEVFRGRRLLSSFDASVRQSADRLGRLGASLGWATRSWDGSHRRTATAPTARRTAPACIASPMPYINAASALEDRAGGSAQARRDLQRVEPMPVDPHRRS